MENVYLGDSVYAELDAAGSIVLTTDNGLGPSNTIVLDLEVFRALVDWGARAIEEANAPRPHLLGVQPDVIILDDLTGEGLNG